MRFLTANHLITAISVAVLGIACRSTPPEVERTLDYQSTRWMIFTEATRINALDSGATIDLVMTPGIVDGMLFIPASVTGTTDFSARLAGSWVKRGDTIRFNEVSLTFVSDLDWILTPETLSAADSVDGSFYDVVLTRMF